MKIINLIMAYAVVSLLSPIAFAGGDHATNLAQAKTYTMTVDPVTIQTDQGKTQGIGYNGTSPGPILRFKEGEDVVINVTNNLSTDTSIHWHGLILPYEMDGVPDISFPGIKPGETFTYRFPIQQSGTYWYHSHSGFQEPDGAFGAIVIESKQREPFSYDRDYVVQFTDKHVDHGSTVMQNLKQMADYYNRQQQTLMDFIADAKKDGLGQTIDNRTLWGGMRMMATDIEDVQGYTPMINGQSPDDNWTGIFTPGERVRLRLINSSGMTYYDVRIPGLKMTVVQADGNNVQPVIVDELRIGVAETYDIIVTPTEKAHTIFAESLGRVTAARGTLAVKQGLSAPVPDLRKPPLLTMADMAMDHSNMKGMDHSNMKGMDHSNMKGMNHSNMKGMDQASESDAFYAPGSGLTPKAANGGKFLSYTDLKAQKPLYEDRDPAREIEIRLTGNMERYIWSINGIKYEDAEPIRLQYGERVRFKFINETMMTHPMHLHGMWSILDNGSGKWNPVKHTVSIAPNTTVYTEVEVDAPGQWAFHCHLVYHHMSGMFRKIIVEGVPAELNTNKEAS